MYDVTDAHMHIGWFNAETGQWDKPEPSLPAFMTQPTPTEDDHDVP